MTAFTEYFSSARLSPSVSSAVPTLLALAIILFIMLGLVYYANHLSELSLIEVMTANGSYRTVLYKTFTERPYELAVDPMNRSVNYLHPSHIFHVSHTCR